MKTGFVTLNEDYVSWLENTLIMMCRNYVTSESAVSGKSDNMLSSLVPHDSICAIEKHAKIRHTSIDSKNIKLFTNYLIEQH